MIELSADIHLKRLKYSTFPYRCFATFPLRFHGISVRLNHEALQGGPIAHSGAHSEASANGTDPTATSSTSACQWDQSFDLTPDEHLRVVIFTLDPLTLGSAVQVRELFVLIHFLSGSRGFINFL